MSQLPPIPRLIKKEVLKAHIRQPAGSEDDYKTLNPPGHKSTGPIKGRIYNKSIEEQAALQKYQNEKDRNVNEMIIRAQGEQTAKQHAKLAQQRIEAAQRKADEAQRKADKAQQKAEKEQDKADEAQRKADEAAARRKPPPSPSKPKSKSFTKTDDTPPQKIILNKSKQFRYK